MMSLVAYDSEISDSEEEQESITKSSDQNICRRNESQKEIVPNAPDIFKLLPLPKQTTSNNLKFREDTEDEFLKKKEIPTEFPKKAIERKTTKIFLPSLSSFDDEELPAIKFQPSLKGTGLLSLLPKPRCENFAQEIKKTIKGTLIPDAVRKQALVSSNSKITQVKNIPMQSTLLYSTKNDSSDESDHEASSADFFSLKETPAPIQALDEGIIDIIDIPQKDDICAPQNNASNQVFHSEHHLNEYETQEPFYDTPPGHSGYEPTNTNMEINDEALRILCGSRARHKGENMQIIDINQQEMLPDPREWLTKALTEDNSKRTSSSKRRGDEPTTQQRRKHQITYLAHQAKANEQELQNQWANNRLSKKQTQSKYGF